jgi:hypothetical protein
LGKIKEFYNSDYSDDKDDQVLVNVFSIYLLVCFTTGDKWLELQAIERLNPKHL